MVIVFEDLQWADHGSLLLLRHLAAAEQSTRVLVLGTFRDSELAHASALRESLGVTAPPRQRASDRVEGPQ
jgi:predicted ATPase